MLSSFALVRCHMSSNTSSRITQRGLPNSREDLGFSKSPATDSSAYLPSSPCALPALDLGEDAKQLICQPVVGRCRWLVHSLQTFQHCKKLVYLAIRGRHLLNKSPHHLPLHQ